MINRTGHPRPLRRLRVLGLVLVFLLVAAGCSDATTAPTTAPTTTAPDGPTTTTVAAPTTTTAPAPEPLPIGGVWEESEVLGVLHEREFPRCWVEAGGSQWIFGNEWNKPLLHRSSDGVVWEEIILEPDTMSTAITLTNVVEGPDGRLVVVGSHGSTCQASIAIEGGFTETGLCKDFRIVLYLSDDDGGTWRKVEPGALSPSGRDSIGDFSVVVTPDGYVATATHRGPDWHIVVFSSADGESWSQIDRIGGGDEPMTADDLLYDGSTFLLTARAHPCAAESINYNTPGWILGAQWPNHLRMWAGDDPGDLRLLAPSDHPLAVAPEDIDCSETDAFDLGNIPTPQVRGAVVDGAITLLDTSSLEAGGSAETYVVARLLDGTWTTTEVTGEVAKEQAGSAWLVDSPHGAAILERTDAIANSELARLQTIPLAADAPITSVLSSGRFFRGEPVGSRVDDESWTVGWRSTVQGEPTFYLLTSVEAVPDPVLCVIEAEARCIGAEARDLLGEEDAGAGLDLTGIDFRMADLARVNWTDTVFHDALLRNATTVLGGTFVGADFTGADLRNAELEDISGASFRDADLRRARLFDAAGVDFTGADLREATLTTTGNLGSLEGANLWRVTIRPPRPDDDGDEPVSIDLSGLDLTNATIANPVGSDQLMIVTSLAGSIVDDVSFQGVDLRGADVTGVDFSRARFRLNAICPDGSTPTGNDFNARC